MLAKIYDFFTTQLATADQGAELSQHQLRLATAALLIEVASVDHDFDSREFSTLKSILENQFDLTETELNELSTLAREESENATSIYQFTQLINEHFSPFEKYRLIKSMWQVAYANGDIDKYEEYIIRKVANLIYVSHSDFVRAKHEARPETSSR